MARARVTQTREERYNKRTKQERMLNMLKRKRRQDEITGTQDTRHNKERFSILCLFHVTRGSNRS
jgi:hypothetical protein